MRTTLSDGTTEVEVLATLALPLPLSHVGDLMAAIGRTAERLGYTNVSMLYVGEHSGSIVGTPPNPT